MESTHIDDSQVEYYLDHHLLIGRYKFIRNLQSGSFGNVSLNLDLNQDKLVCLKLVKYQVLDEQDREVEKGEKKKEKEKEKCGEKKETLDSGAGAAKSVPQSGSITSLSIAKQEINILRKLSHKNICNLLNYYYSPNYTIMILEYCENGDLYDMIHKNLLTVEQIHKLSIQITDALNYVHKLNIYHRDLKPENILIDENHNFKLCDWGLLTTSRYSSEFNIGTNKYLAPECYQDFSKLTHYDCKKSDYWSFGITLLTTIYGLTPFKNNILQDANFKTFKNLANILLDIYPTMNLSIFNIVLDHLLIINDANDTEELLKRIKMRDLNEFIEKFVQINQFHIEDDFLDSLEILEIQDVFEQQFDREFSIISKNLDIFDGNQPQYNSLNSSINSNYLIDDKFYKDINNIWENMKNDKISFDFNDDFKVASWADWWWRGC